MTDELSPIKRVVLVEDHPMVRRAIRDVIKRTNLEVVGEFAGAEEAARHLPGLRPDVVLVDLSLPGRSGLTFIREMRAVLPRTQFIVLSASHDEQDVVEAVRAGARGFLSKDLDVTGLTRALTALERGELPFSRRLEAMLFERFVFNRSHRETDADRLSELTLRENEILVLLTEGLTDREIAERLVIGRRTVETHVTHILHKLGVSRRAEAARIYRGGD